MGFCAPTGRRAQESRVFGVDDIGPNTMTPCDLSAACIDWAGRGVQFIGALARAGAGARECGGFAWGKLVDLPRAPCVSMRSPATVGQPSRTHEYRFSHEVSLPFMDADMPDP